MNSNFFDDNFEIESRKVEFGINLEFSFNDLPDEVKEEVLAGDFNLEDEEVLTF